MSTSVMSYVRLKCGNLFVVFYLLYLVLICFICIHFGKEVFYIMLSIMIIYIVIVVFCTENFLGTRKIHYEYFIIVFLLEMYFYYIQVFFLWKKHIFCSLWRDLVNLLSKSLVSYVKLKGGNCNLFLIFVVIFMWGTNVYWQCVYWNIFRQ